jgi:hypothetical protein
MSNPISALTPQKPVPEQAPTPAATPKPSNSASRPSSAVTVNISSAAQSILQETEETHAQTVQEANGGDGQARRLLAREAAANPAQKG